jgi:hypothetical protein
MIVDYGNGSNASVTDTITGRTKEKAHSKQECIYKAMASVAFVQNTLTAPEPIQIN